MEEKVKAVEAVFEELDRGISSFQQKTGMHCQWGCGKCCFKPDIEATILEFIPFAFFLHQQDLAHEWLEKLTDAQTSICLILNPTQAGAGLCSQYKHRGLICRLFGYSARTNKYGARELVTCTIIKTEQTENFKTGEKLIAEGETVPVMGHYYMKLHAIDFELTRDFYPINQAMRKALEVVLQYYAYR